MFSFPLTPPDCSRQTFGSPRLPIRRQRIRFMVNRNLIRHLEDDDLANQLALLVPEDQGEELLLDALELEQQDYIQGKIVDGRIVDINDEWALMDVGFKSEGTVALDEWGPDEEPPKIGDIVKVLIEEMEDELGAAGRSLWHDFAQQAQG